jgi:ribosome-binding factor A
MSRFLFLLNTPQVRPAFQPGRIRGFLGRDMHIRQVPELHFVFDDSERKAREIDALIDRVMKDNSLEKP